MTWIYSVIFYHMYCIYIAQSIVASVPIINPIAVADVETLLSAIAPDCVLNESREHCRKAPVELSYVNPPGDCFDDFSSTAGPVAGRAIDVVGSEPAQDAGAGQEIVHQRID